MVRLLAICALALVVSSCGAGSDSRSVPSTTTPEAQEIPEPVQSSLVFHRADGSEIEMPGKPIAWCGPDDSREGIVLQIAAIMGIERTSEEWLSYWHVWAIPEDVEEGKPLSFPLPRAWGDDRGAQIFVGDSVTENEANTSGEDSSGRIVFSESSCEVGAPIEFTVDAVIDSEFFDGDRVDAKGTFRGVLEEPPEGYS